MRNIDINYILNDGIEAEEILAIPETTVQNASDPFSKARSFGLHIKAPFSAIFEGGKIKTVRDQIWSGGRITKSTKDYTLDSKLKVYVIPLGLKLYLPKYTTFLFVPLMTGALSYIVDKTVKEPFRVVLYLDQIGHYFEQGDIIMKVIPIVEEDYSFNYRVAD